MGKSKHSTYALALLLPLLALLVCLQLSVTFGALPLLILFAPGLLLVAALGGLLPGLLAIMVTGLVTATFLLPPIGSLVIAQGHDLFQWVMLLVSGLLACGLAEAMWRARGRSEAALMAMRAAESLAQERGHFIDAAVEQAGHVIVVLDPLGRIVRFNRAAETLSGFSFAELEGRPIWERLIPPEAAADVRGVFDNLINNLPVDHEYEWLTRDGSHRLLHWRNNVLRDAEGRIVHVVAMGYDITEQRRLQETLAISEARLQEVVRATHAGVYELDLRHDGYYVSREFFDLIGELDTEGSAKDALLRLLERVHPDDREQVLDRGEACRQQGFITAASEYRVVTREGAQIWLRDRCRATEWLEDGVPTRLVGAITDITRQKVVELRLGEQEAHYHGLFQDSAAVKMVVDPENMDIVEVNAAAVDFLGYSKAQLEQMKLSDLSVLPPSQVTANFAALMLQAHAIPSRVRLASGELRHVQVFNDSIHLCGRRLIHSTLHDVSALVETESALLESQAQLHLALESAGAGLWSWDIASNNNVWSEEVWPLYGLDRDRVTPGFDAWLRSIDPRDVAEVQANLQRSLETGSANELTWRVRGGNPEQPRWLLGRGTPVLGEDGQVRRYVGIVLDISERKRADVEAVQYRDRLEILVSQRTEELRETHEHLLTNQAAMSSVGIGISWVDAESGRLLYVNDRFAAMHEYAVTDMSSMTLFDINPGMTPAEFAEANVRVREQGHTQFEARHRTRRGREFPVATSTWYRPPGKQGSATVIGFVVDISERKAAETRVSDLLREQQAILDNSSVGLMYVRDRKLVWANDYFLEIFAYSRDQVLGQSTRMFFASEEDYVCFGEKAYAQFAQGGRYVVEYEFLRKDRSRVPIRLSGQAIDPAQPSAGSIWCVEDMTSAKATEASLHRAKEAAEVAARAKGEFLANMSHEIRTPLNGVLGQAQLGYQDNVGREAAQRRFRRILDSGKLLLTVINDILDFSKIEAGRLDIESVPFDPRHTLEEAVELMRERATVKGLGLHADLDTLPPGCLGDPVRIEQIALNLLGNAIKFTERGEVRLTARHEGGELLIQVSDTGLGIAPEALARLFQPFVQADGSITRKFGGSGLGLVISRRLADLMGGNIRVARTSPAGSIFELRIPALEAAPQKQKPVVSVPAGGQPLAGLRLLVAEDNEINQELLVDFLKEAGAEFVLVSNGREAVVAANGQGPFAAMLMDVEMPEMNGLEATRLIKASHPDLPVIGQTAHALKAEHDKCLEAGMVATITKPIFPDVLVAAVLAQVRPASGLAQISPVEPKRVQSSTGLIDWTVLEQSCGELQAEQLIATALAWQGEEVVYLRNLAARGQYRDIARLAQELVVAGNELCAAALTAAAIELLVQAQANDPRAFAAALGVAGLLEGVLEELREGRPDVRCVLTPAAGGM